MDELARSRIGGVEGPGAGPAIRALPSTSRALMGSRIAGWMKRKEFFLTRLPPPRPHPGGPPPPREDRLPGAPQSDRKRPFPMNNAMNMPDTSGPTNSSPCCAVRRRNSNPAAPHDRRDPGTRQGTCGRPLRILPNPSGTMG